MADDSSLRSTFGLVLTARKLDEDSIRFTVDDVSAESTEWPMRWKTEVFMTQNDYDAKAFMASDLTDEQFSEIGVTIVAMLAARLRTR